VDYRTFSAISPKLKDSLALWGFGEGDFIDSNTPSTPSKMLKCLLCRRLVLFQLVDNLLDFFSSFGLEIFFIRSQFFEQAEELAGVHSLFIGDVD